MHAAPHAPSCTRAFAAALWREPPRPRPAAPLPPRRPAPPPVRPAAHHCPPANLGGRAAATAGDPPVGHDRITAFNKQGLCSVGTNVVGYLLLGSLAPWNLHSPAVPPNPSLPSYLISVPLAARIHFARAPASLPEPPGRACAAPTPPSWPPAAPAGWRPAPAARQFGPAAPRWCAAGPVGPPPPPPAAPPGAVSRCVGVDGKGWKDGVRQNGRVRVGVGDPQARQAVR